MRGRTALYGPKHVAQVVAIKRLQAMGRSLSEIQALWPTLDDRTLARMSGVELPASTKPPARPEFWKREPRPSAAADVNAAEGAAENAADAADVDDASVSGTAGARAAADPASSARRAAPAAAVELRVELAPNVVLSLSIADDGVAISPADVRALRAAAAPLLAELASRRLASHARGEEP
jgi:DNA-binding transcriptional MerR regulator